MTDDITRQRRQRILDYINSLPEDQKANAFEDTIELARQQSEQAVALAREELKDDPVALEALNRRVEAIGKEKVELEREIAMHKARLGIDDTSEDRKPN